MQHPSHRARPLTAPGLPRPGGGGTTGLLPPGRLATSSAPRGNRILVTVRGELDLASGDALRDRLAEALAASGGGLTLDLSGLGFCDCAGLNVLLELRRRALSQGKTVVLQAAGPAVDRLLGLIGAQDLFSAPRSRRVVRPAGPAPSASKPGTSPGVMSSRSGADSEGRRVAPRV